LGVTAQVPVPHQPVVVVLWIAVPLEIAGGAPAVIELATVGIAVPVAILQMSTVAVPVSSTMFHAEIVQLNGTVV
jgi:hypothetical protein